MSDTFKTDEFRQFLKEAYAKSNKLYIDFNTIISDSNRKEAGEYQQFFEAVIKEKTEYENGYPYTRLVVNKTYSIYNYLCELTGWSDLFGRVYDAEIFLCAIYFMEENECIGGIVLDFRSYNNHYFSN